MANSNAPAPAEQAPATPVEQPAEQAVEAPAPEAPGTKAPTTRATRAPRKAAKKATNDKKAEPAKAAPAKAAKADAPDLMALLLAALKERGVKPQVVWNPKRTYVRLLVGKVNIGSIDKQTRAGILVKPALQKDELPSGSRGFAATGAKTFGVRGVFADEASLRHAVDAFAAAAAKGAAR